MHRLFLPILIASSLLSLVAGLGDGAPLPKRNDTNSLGMKFVKLPKGAFYMGWNGRKKGKRTEIKEDFEIAIHTVTQGQWQIVMGNNPSYFSRTGDGKDEVKDIKDENLKQFPVETISWDDPAEPQYSAQEFIKKLNEREEKGKGWVYRLPTEAEWEYACRGGATLEVACSFSYYFDKPTNDLSSEQANFNGDHPYGAAARGPNLYRPAKVGSYRPNKLGLYDMHGNVWQWCADWYTEGENRVIRGGSWNDSGQSCRAAFRNWMAPSGNFLNLGFRLVRVRSGK